MEHGTDYDTMMNANTEYRIPKSGRPRRFLSSVFCLLSSLNQRKTAHGFTLIEILVAITLFTVIMISAVGSLISINDANRKTQAVRSAVDNVNFALDNMSRRLRTGMNYRCLTASDAHYPNSNVPVSPDPKDCPSGDEAIAFTAAEYLGSTAGDTGQSGSLAGGSVVYRLGPVDSEGNRAIEMNTRMKDGSFPTSYTKMTSPDVNIEQMRFVVLGSEGNDGKQPYVLIVVRGSVDTSKGSKKQRTTFRVQTTVSQRLLDNTQ